MRPDFQDIIESGSDLGWGIRTSGRWNQSLGIEQNQFLTGHWLPKRQRSDWGKPAGPDLFLCQIIESGPHLGDLGSGRPGAKAGDGQRWEMSRTGTWLVIGCLWV
jgi:hypothetical protein